MLGTGRSATSTGTFRAEGAAGLGCRPHDCNPAHFEYFAKMPLPTTHLMDELATSYVQAVAAVAGCTIGVQRKDFGIDGTLRSILNSEDGYHETGYPVDFQLKATTTAELQNELVVFDLKVANYNKIVRRETRSAPYYLILVSFSGTEHTWCKISDGELVLGAQAYWWAESGDPVTNSSTKRIRIPISQRLTTRSISWMLAAAEARYEL